MSAFAYDFPAGLPDAQKENAHPPHDMPPTAYYLWQQCVYGANPRPVRVETAEEEKKIRYQHLARLCNDAHFLCFLLRYLNLKPNSMYYLQDFAALAWLNHADQFQVWVLAYEAELEEDE